MQKRIRLKKKNANKIEKIKFLFILNPEQPQQTVVINLTGIITTPCIIAGKKAELTRAWTFISVFFNVQYVQILAR